MFIKQDIFFLTNGVLLVKGFFHQMHTASSVPLKAQLTPTGFTRSSHSPVHHSFPPMHRVFGYRQPKSCTEHTARAAWH